MRKTSARRVRESSKAPAKTTRTQKPKEKKTLEGNDEFMVSTGSTLLDLEISGGRKRGGGIPGGIMVEIYGPNQAGKTVFLSELAGGIQRKGGEVKFWDAEARLNKQFASMFDLKIEDCNYGIPDQVRDVFAPLLKWEPKPEGKVHGVFIDSFAALNGSLEEGDDEDKRGQSRAKDFSTWLRKLSPRITKNNWLLVGSNQVRDKQNAVAFGKQTTTPCGKAIPHHASLRLEIRVIKSLKEKKKIAGKEYTKQYGNLVEVEVVKSTVWRPHGKAKAYIIYDYGIDDVRANLQFLKDYTTGTSYWTGDSSMDAAIQTVEEDNLEGELKEATIDLWEEIQEKFKKTRKKKVRV